MKFFRWKRYLVIMSSAAVLIGAFQNCSPSGFDPSVLANAPSSNLLGNPGEDDLFGSGNPSQKEQGSMLEAELTQDDEFNE